MMLAESLGFIAGSIGVSSSLPQALRIRKLGSSNGVSLITWMLMYGYSTVWLGYGISTSSPSQILANGLSAIFALIVLVSILRRSLTSYFILAIIPTIVILIALNVSSQVLAPILLLSAGTSLSQVWKSNNSWRTRSFSAVSIHMLVMSELASFLWLGYALLGHRTIVEVTSGISIVLTAMILAFELGRKERAGNA